MNREGAGMFKAYSAGSRPGTAPHPYTLDLLKGLNHDTGFARCKSWEEFTGPDAPQMDFVFTVCDNAAAEECPFWPGQPMTAHWGVPDPVKAEGTESARRFAFSDTYRMLRNRISIFVSLPIGSLDRVALQRSVDDIGKAPAKAD